MVNQNVVQSAEPKIENSKISFNSLWLTIWYNIHVRWSLGSGSLVKDDGKHVTDCIYTKLSTVMKSTQGKYIIRMFCRMYKVPCKIRSLQSFVGSRTVLRPSGALSCSEIKDLFYLSRVVLIFILHTTKIDINTKKRSVKLFLILALPCKLTFFYFRPFAKHFHQIKFIELIWFEGFASMKLQANHP